MSEISRESGKESQCFFKTVFLLRCPGSEEPGSQFYVSTDSSFTFELLCAHLRLDFLSSGIQD